MSEVVQIKNIACSCNNGMYRVSADVGDNPLWFESSDVSLLASPEAFSGGLLVQSLIMQVDLACDVSLSPIWLVNAEKIMKIYREWFGYKPIKIDAERRSDRLPQKGSQTALLFSGGVDSFYSLLRGPFPINNLVFLQGCDVLLSETERLKSMDASLREVAAQVGAKAISIKTNLREHPIAGRKFKISHGGVFSSVGHLLPEVDRLIISSSQQKGVWDLPFGSHWDTDPLWGSESLEIVHYGEEFGRNEKLRGIAGETVVQQNLSVCQGKIEDRLNDPSYNCGKCEKCVRTMLIISQSNSLQNYPKFLEKNNLNARLDEVLYLSDYLVPVYEDILAHGLEDNLAHSVILLLGRTKKIKPFIKFGRHVSKALAHLMLPKSFDRRISGFLKALKK